MIKAVIKESIGFFKKHWLYLILITFVLVGIFQVLMYFPVIELSQLDDSADLSSIMMSLVSMIALAIPYHLGLLMLHIVVLLMVNDDLRRKEVDLGSIIKRSATAFPKAIIVYILSLLVIMVGFLFFVIPGFIFGFWLFLVVPVVVLEDNKAIGAVFKRSKALVKGHFRHIAGIMLGIGLPYIIADNVIGLLDGSLLSPEQTVNWLGFSASLILSMVCMLLVAIAFSLFYLRLAGVGDNHAEPVVFPEAGLEM